MSVTKQGQSFIDIVTQTTGSFENSLEMAILNDISITDEIEIGSEFITGKITNERTVAFLNSNEPATAVSQAQLVEVENLGIGAMVIGSTFIVG